MPEEQRSMTFTVAEAVELLARAAGYPPDKTTVKFQGPNGRKMSVESMLVECKVSAEINQPRPSAIQATAAHTDDGTPPPKNLEPENVSGVCIACQAPGVITDVPPLAKQDTPVWCPNCSAKQTLGDYTRGVVVKSAQTMKRRKSQKELQEEQAIARQMDSLGLD